jgi:hypothetical protein
MGLAELAFVAVLLGLAVLGLWEGWRVLQRNAAGTSPAGLPARERAWRAEQIAHARWAPAHDEVDGVTRVLLRRSYTDLDGRPVVLEERVFDTFPADDPAWEARFTEAMAGARFRCSYLNAEDSRE